ncbi:aspartyl protease family protein [Pontibacter arcticus]|uniref:Aspartate aminotransferase n=1 Tax=Pontibacter arcticus TaxID=2080288 RepID=A0A364RGN2_9BACT|nr:aspartyl protease family protein [Pontibacter arcticus]RAU83478.1 aspartate aminotransferase [Pontibacter arcticus]
MPLAFCVMVRIGFLFLLFILLLPLPGLSQQLPFADSDTVYFRGNRKKITIPFKLVHNLIIIPVQINSSNSLNFILDSGVKHTLITKLFYTDSLDINNAREIEVKGLGTGYTIKALYSAGNRLVMPGIEGKNQQVYVLMEDVFNLSTRMGMPVHGIIGYDIFKNFIVKINYSSQELTLYRPDTKVKKHKRAEEYPLYIEQNKAYVYGKVSQHNGDTISVKLVIDTGASHTLSLYLPSHNKLALPPKVMQAYLGRGLSGDINGKIGRLNSFTLGKYELTNMPASYPDTEAIQAALNLSNRNGSLGSDVLKRFTVVLDYPHKRMMLVPNRKYKEPFQYNLAGFELTTPLPGTNFYVVSNVIDGSPAKLKGLMPGDQLINISGRDCTELDLNNVLKLMEGRPGSRLRMQLRRDSKLINVDLVLQSAI